MNHVHAVFLTIIASALAVSSASVCSADPAKGSSLAGLVDQGQQWLKAAALGPTAASDVSQSPRTDEPTGGPRAAAAPLAESGSPRPFVDPLPAVSIVARDWRGSLRLLGSRTMLLDELRPEASNRMVMGRVATDGVLSFFGHVGIGQWRVDTVMFPNAVADSDLAGQVGGGFELHIGPRLRVAGEVDYTMLYRDLHYAQGEVAPRMTSYLLAAVGTF